MHCLCGPKRSLCLTPLRPSAAAELQTYSRWQSLSDSEHHQQLQVSLSHLRWTRMLLPAHTEQGKDLSGFFKSTEGYFKTDQVKAWDSALRQRRSQRLALQQNRERDAASAPSPPQNA